jgi:DNA polymerase-1
LSLIELHQTLKAWNARVLLDVHDSLLFECPHEHVRAVCDEIRRVMCDPKIPGWPQLKIDIKIGNNWANKMKEEKWYAQELVAA